MSEFVGRTGSNRVYSYPETRGGSGTPPFARNYATGSKGGAVGPGGAEITWNAVDAGAPPTSADVPITPIATGLLLVSGVITVNNPTGGAILVTITVHLDHVAVPTPFAAVSVPAGVRGVIPFLAETEVISPLNETHQIEVAIDGNGVTLIVDGCVVNVQEVAIATG